MEAPAYAICLVSSVGSLMVTRPWLSAAGNSFAAERGYSSGSLRLC